MPVALFDGDNPEAQEQHFLSETERGHQTPMHIRPSFVCGCGDIPAPIQQNYTEGWSLLACRNNTCQARNIEKVVFWPRSQYRLPMELGAAEFQRCPRLLQYLTSLGRIHPHQQVVEHEPIKLTEEQRKRLEDQYHRDEHGRISKAPALPTGNTSD
jgi:hypothetical protein